MIVSILFSCALLRPAYPPASAALPATATAPQGQPAVLPVQTTQPPADDPQVDDPPKETVLQYKIDRKNVPNNLPYQDLTLEIYVGSARSVSATADGKPVTLRYNDKTGYVMVTTGASDLTLRVLPGSGMNLSGTKVGTYHKAVLKDGRKWAWSHGFDDNTMFKEYGIPAFTQYGWRATVFIIGSKLSETRDEYWIIDRPDLVRLAKMGWGIGNHSWTHTSVENIGGSAAAEQDLLKLDAYLRGVMTEAGLPNRRLIAFAAPAFDSDYMPVVRTIRDKDPNGLLFNESGSAGIMRVDPDVRDGSGFAVFDLDAQIGREFRVEAFGDGGSYDKEFRDRLGRMLGQVKHGQHFWLNTFSHGVDDKYPDTGLFAFLPWLHKNYGPGGDDSVWVAPSEEIVSYLLVRDKTRITLNGEEISEEQPIQFFLPLAMQVP